MELGPLLPRGCLLVPGSLGQDDVELSVKEKRNAAPDSFDGSEPSTRLLSAKFHDHLHFFSNHHKFRTSPTISDFFYSASASE